LTLALEATKQSDYSLLLFADDKLFANHFSNSFIENFVNNVSCDQTMETERLTNIVNVTNTWKFLEYKLGDCTTFRRLSFQFLLGAPCESVILWFLQNNELSAKDID
jgi:hypothetical protein